MSVEIRTLLVGVREIVGAEKLPLVTTESGLARKVKVDMNTIPDGAERGDALACGWLEISPYWRAEAYDLIVNDRGILEYHSRQKGAAMDLVVKLDREEIEKAIAEGNNSFGSRYLAVRPSGAWSVHWADTNRSWDPWGDDSCVIGIPALFPEGEGQESELAQECLEDRLGKAEAKLVEEQVHQDNSSVVEYADERFPTWMQAARENQAEWLLAAFLAACNGDGADSNDLAPWGVSGNYGEEVVEPPFEFEWAE